MGLIQSCSLPESICLLVLVCFFFYDPVCLCLPYFLDDAWHRLLQQLSGSSKSCGYYAVAGTSDLCLAAVQLLLQSRAKAEVLELFLSARETGDQGCRQPVHCAPTVKALPKREPGASNLSTIFKDVLRSGFGKCPCGRGAPAWAAGTRGQCRQGASLICICPHLGQLFTSRCEILAWFLQTEGWI